MLNYLVFLSWFMISIYFNVSRFQGFSSPPWKINLNVWNDLDKSHPMTILSEPSLSRRFPDMFFTAFLPPSPASPSPARARGWVISGQSPGRSFVWSKDKKLRRRRLFESLSLSGRDRIISTDEMFYGTKIWRHGQVVGPLKNAQNFICTNYKQWTPALSCLSEEMVIFKCFIAPSQGRATLLLPVAKF